MEYWQDPRQAAHCKWFKFELVHSNVVEASVCLWVISHFPPLDVSQKRTVTSSKPTYLGESLGDRLAVYQVNLVFSGGNRKEC
jgi:hypothetical protein